MRLLKIGTSTGEPMAACSCPTCAASQPAAPVVSPDAMAGALRAKAPITQKDRVRAQNEQQLSEIGPAAPPAANYTKQVAPDMAAMIRERNKK